MCRFILSGREIRGNLRLRQSLVFKHNSIDRFRFIYHTSPTCLSYRRDRNGPSDDSSFCSHTFDNSGKKKVIENNVDEEENENETDESLQTLSLGASVYMSGVLTCIIERTLRLAVQHASEHGQNRRSANPNSKIVDSDIVGAICRDSALKQLYVCCLGTEGKLHKPKSTRQNVVEHGSKSPSMSKKILKKSGPKRDRLICLCTGNSIMTLLRFVLCIGIWYLCSVMF